MDERRRGHDPDDEQEPEIVDPGGEEITLDPADWEGFRALAHRMVDDQVDHLRSLRRRPPWQRPSSAAREAFARPLPRRGVGAEAAYEEFLRWVRPYPTGNLHPRFWGWVNGTGTPLGMMAEMLAAGLNANAAGFDQAASYCEAQVIAWLAEALGLPAEGGGLLTSGGSMANVLGLAVARHARAGFDVRAAGLAAGPPLAVYASSESHSSVVKAVELLGLGREGLRLVPVGRDLTIAPRALEAAIAADRQRGLRPIAVMANAGTVNTGAVDPLRELARLTRREDLWLHVDGAFGALAALSPALRPRVAGLEEADSVAFDLHKWMVQPYAVGCLWVRDRRLHRDAFTVPAGYLARQKGGLAGGDAPNFANLGPELSRPFRALKVWMALLAEGSERFAALVEQNVAQAAYLARRIEASPRLKLAAPVPLNVVCFRLHRRGWHLGRLNDLNQRLLVELQERGIAVPSGTTLSGRFCLRVALVNHRTRRSDLDALVAACEELGEEL